MVWRARKCCWAAGRSAELLQHCRAGHQPTLIRSRAEHLSGVRAQMLLGGEEKRESMEEAGELDTQGEAVGAIMSEQVDTKGYRLVITGHSLGAGAAALISLKLRDRFDGAAPARTHAPVLARASLVACCARASLLLACGPLRSSLPAKRPVQEGEW